MKTREALLIVLRAAEQNANGHEHAAEILRAVHIVDGEVLKRARCDHKFVDSKCCLKCGWEPGMSARLDEVPVVHLEHSHPDYTLCGKLNTRLTPISVNNSTDCVACIIHAQEGTEAEVARD